ncbi:hypothetical protein AVEN_192959-1 [Araneus ventricosus]|uniref:Uncharacterized protein n=1 Tax=Araneus ventricosus TaxID=182803 RepID=A0A4Y2TC28_ARAVE|nr:hypothetical protein AVEN_192959-1 [Araneus ventricosus]
MRKRYACEECAWCARHDSAMKRHFPHLGTTLADLKPVSSCVGRKTQPKSFREGKSLSRIRNMQRESIGVASLQCVCEHENSPFEQTRSG